MVDTAVDDVIVNVLCERFSKICARYFLFISIFSFFLSFLGLFML